jgi:hypothetical protein
MLSQNRVEAKHFRFFVAEFILSHVEGLLRMTWVLGFLRYLTYLSQPIQGEGTSSPLPLGEEP